MAASGRDRSFSLFVLFAFLFLVALTWSSRSRCVCLPVGVLGTFSAYSSSICRSTYTRSGWWC